MPISFAARALVAIIAGGAFVVTFFGFEALESGARRTPEAPPATSKTIEILSAAKSLKLATVEIRTTAKAHLTDPTALGTVDVSIEAPARLLYGCDLSALTTERIAYSPVSSTYVLSVPQPTRIATEVNTAAEKVETSTGWFRTQAQTDKLLALARTQLQHEADELRESDEQRSQILRDTRDQLLALVHRIVGDDTPVEVHFAAEMRK